MPPDGARSGAWFVTSTGRRIFVDTPDPKSVDIEDIAHALSHVCRFGGHTSEFYSVAQHSVLVSYMVHPDRALQALLHDAAQAYVGDEAAWWWAIAARFGIETELHLEVKVADERALATEMRDLMPRHPWLHECRLDFEPLESHIVPASPKMARSMFLQRFRRVRPEP